MVTEEAGSSLSLGKTESQIPQSGRFLARQPIFNLQRKVVAYELLFRSGWENHFSGEVNQATRQTLDNCLSMDIESLVSDKLAFVNCTREALVDRLATLLPPKTTVLEVLETIEPDAEVVEACRDLRRMGYRIALDDFIPRPEMRPLVEIADYVKVDFRLCDVAMRRAVRQMIRNTNAALVAEKVEDEEEFQVARNEGYKYFQGFFFCRPRVVTRPSIPANQMNFIHLLAELAQEPLKTDNVLKIVQMDTSLCYRLLRLANSQLWGLRGDVTSVRGAFMLVGENRFRMLVMVAASNELAQDQSPALLSLSLERARFCELFAPLIGENPTEQFLLGLLSVLDAMLHTSMEAITRSLPLRPEAKQALLGAKNHLAIPLCLIRSFELGAWGDCSQATSIPGVDEDTLAKLYVESLRWAEESIAKSSV
jgi:EAL and modified HD-GYP domain-containing signal transduction protein